VVAGDAGGGPSGDGSGFQWTPPKSPMQKCIEVAQQRVQDTIASLKSNVISDVWNNVRAGVVMGLPTHNFQLMLFTATGTWIAVSSLFWGTRERM
jgi:hypothetical protein